MAKNSPVFFETNNERSFAQVFPKGQFGDATRQGETTQCSHPTIVLMHGLGSSAADLEVLAQSLKPFARTLCVDFPGFGQREAENAEILDEYVEAVCRELDAAGVQQAIWLGCSFGGHVALRASLIVPSRVSHLLLLASGGLFKSLPASLIDHYQEDNLRARSLETVRAACEALVRRSNALTEQFVTERLAAHTRGFYAGIVNAARAAIADATGAELERVRQPVTLIHGVNDPLVPLDIAHQAAERLPVAEIFELDNVGHMPWLEVPSLVATLIEKVLRSTEIYSKFNESPFKKTPGSFLRKVPA